MLEEHTDIPVVEYLGNLARTGEYPSVALPQTLAQQWECTFPGTPHDLQPPMIISGDLLLGGHLTNEAGMNKLYAVDIATGTVRWSAPAPGGSSDPPAASGSIICYSCQQGVMAVSRENGDPLWQVAEEPDTVLLPPLIIDPLVCYGITRKNESFLNAVDLHTGKQCWQVALGKNAFRQRNKRDDPFMCAAVANSILCCITHEDRINGIDLKRGQLLWQSELEVIQNYGGEDEGAVSTQASYPPIIVNGIVYIATTNGCILCYDQYIGIKERREYLSPACLSEENEARITMAMTRGIIISKTQNAFRAQKIEKIKQIWHGVVMDDAWKFPVGMCVGEAFVRLAHQMCAAHLPSIASATVP